MSAATGLQVVDEDVLYRQHVLRGMTTPTFEGLFYANFENLRTAIMRRDWVEIEQTIQALEGSCVTAAESFDEIYDRAAKAN